MGGQGAEAAGALGLRAQPAETAAWPAHGGGKDASLLQAPSLRAAEARNSDIASSRRRGPGRRKPKQGLHASSYSSSLRHRSRPCMLGELKRRAEEFLSEVQAAWRRRVQMGKYKVRYTQRRLVSTTCWALACQGNLSLHAPHSGVVAQLAGDAESSCGELAVHASCSPGSKQARSDLMRRKLPAQFWWLLSALRNARNSATRSHHRRLQRAST